MVRYNAPSGESLTGLTALVVTGTGSSAYEASAASQYLTDRGAAVDFYCSSTLPQHNVLSEGYLPKFTIQNCSMSPPKPASSYDILIMANGYSTVLPLREASHPFQTFLSDFFNPVVTNKTRVFLGVGGAADVLISQPALLGALIEKDLASSLPLGWMSLSFSSAIDHCVGVADKSSPQCVAIQHSESAAAAAQTGGSADTSNASATALLQPLTASPTLFLALGSSPADFLAVLMDVSATVFRRYSIDVTPLNCSEPDHSTDLVLPPSFIAVTDATLLELTTGTNEASSILNISLEGSCHNKQNNDFCANTPVSLVVANGAHDQSVISAIAALTQAGTNLRVFCPDSDETIGVVYLMPEPSTAPTYALSCTTYLNESDLVKESIVVIVTGPQATHGFLAENQDVMSVLQFTGTYSLAGTALVMLLGLKSREDVVEVPLTPYTTTDLTLAGYNTTLGSGKQQNLFWYRDPSLKRAKVLSGYTTLDNVMFGFDAFLQRSIELVVWNAVDDSLNYDMQVVSVWLGIGVVALVVVFLTKCRRREQKIMYQRIAPAVVETSIPAVYPDRY